MRTETTVNNTVKAERRKVFWRLYSLPWIISIILLMGISGAFIWVIKDLKMGNSQREEELRSIGKVEGQKDIWQEAIDNGHGEWFVNRKGEAFFTWKETIVKKPKILWKTNTITNVITNEIVRVITNDNSTIRGMSLVEDIPEVRDYAFGIDDYELSRRLGIDLESSLIDRINIGIDNVFDYSNVTMDRILFRMRLKDEIRDRVRSSFDGFETYHKLK